MLFELIEECHRRNGKAISTTDMPRCRDAGPDPAFMIACMYGELDIAQKILENYVVNIHFHGDAAFAYACFGHMDIVEWLLSLEPSLGKINMRANNELAFVFACRGSFPNIAEMLISLEPTHGSTNIHVREEELFIERCSKGDMKMSRRLVALEPTHGKIDIHSKNDSPFRFASQNNRREIVRWLFTFESTRGKIDVHAGRTPEEHNLAEFVSMVID